MSRPPELVTAEQALLTDAQRASRAAAGKRLAFALPLEVWLDHWYSVPPRARRHPVAERGTEKWYSFARVVRRTVNPRSKRRVIVAGGGAMSGVAARRR